MTQPSRRVAQQMGNLVAEFSHAGPSAVNSAAAEAKRIHLGEIRRAAGGDLRLSRVGKKGAPVGVRYFPARSTVNAEAFVRATGPLHLLEHESQAHPILPRGVGRAQGRSRAARREAKQALYNALFGGTYAGVKPLSTPYGPRFRVQHPGVRNPKRPWAKGFEKAKPVVARAVRSQYGSAFARGMR